jgi:hypothetical protein
MLRRQRRVFDPIHENPQTLLEVFLVARFATVDEQGIADDLLGKTKYTMLCAVVRDCDLEPPSRVVCLFDYTQNKTSQFVVNVAAIGVSLPVDKLLFFSKNLTAAVQASQRGARDRLRTLNSANMFNLKNADSISHSVAKARRTKYISR